jgi:hypothetical protein
LQSGCAEKGIYNPQPDLMKKDSIILGFEQLSLSLTRNKMKSKRTVMEISDRAKGEGLQIPLFNAAGLQIRPNGERRPFNY